MLQQILFYKKLGFDLRRIKAITSRPKFDKIAALKSHRTILEKNLAETRTLIATIDKTIEHLQGTKRMKSSELFAGFSAEQQAHHEQYLIDRYGECMKDSIAQSKVRVKDWTQARWQKSGEEFVRICKDLVRCMDEKRPAQSPEVQAVVRRHYQWLTQFWTPTRESYAGHSQLIVDSELRKAYEPYHPRLPEFTAEAIKIFAERELA
jgi:hypothetical protein